MSYLDLPDDWMDRPLDNPDITCNVADFFLSDHDRINNTLLLVRCNKDCYLEKHPIMVSHMNWNASSLKRDRCLKRFFRTQPPAMIVALAAEHRLPRAVELAWSITVEDLCTTFDIELLGIHSLSRQGNFQITPPQPLPQPDQVRRWMARAVAGDARFA